MRLGLVLGAGGTAGEAYHRGVVRALEERGLAPARAAVVVGTSAGSIVAASLRRHGHPVDAGEPSAQARRVRLPRTAALALVRRPRQLLNAALLSREFATGRTSLDALRKGIASQHRAWPDAPTYVVAVRRRDGKRVVFGRDDAPRPAVDAAVAASCAIPRYFSPVEIDGTSYVDGGLHSPTNADVVADLPLDLVVISSPMSVELRSVRGRLDVPLRLLFHGYLREEVWALRRRGTRVVTVEPDGDVLTVMGLNMMNGRNRSQIERAAYALALRRLEDIPPGGTAR